MAGSRLGKAAAAAALMAVSTPALASSTSEYAKITGVFATANGALLFSLRKEPNNSTPNGDLSPARDAVPSCASGLPGRWAIDASTPAGQTALTTLLWALDHRRQVTVIGTGTCSIWSDTETVAMLSIQDES